MRALWVLLIAGAAGGVHWWLTDGSAGRGLGPATATPAPESLSPDDPRRITGDKRIVMIAADWCGYCRKQQRDFERAGVRYRVLDYDQAEGKSASRALGTRGVPITVIGQQVVHGYRPEELDAHLRPLGYDVY
jgi:glutaredoxin